MCNSHLSLKSLALSLVSFMLAVTNFSEDEHV